MDYNAALKALQNYTRTPPHPPNPLAGFPQIARLEEKIAQDTITNLFKAWNLIKNNKPKQESASAICNDFKVGLITGRQAITLLTGLGYTARTAQRILSLCYLRKLPKTLQTMPKPGTKEYQAMQDALNEGPPNGTL